MSEAWITQSGQGDGAGGGQVWSGSSGGQELEPEDKAREVRWCVVDAASESTVDREAQRSQAQTCLYCPLASGVWVGG